MQISLDILISDIHPSPNRGHAGNWRWRLPDMLLTFLSLFLPFFAPFHCSFLPNHHYPQPEPNSFFSLDQ